MFYATTLVVSMNMIVPFNSSIINYCYHHLFENLKPKSLLQCLTKPSKTFSFGFDSVKQVTNCFSFLLFYENQWGKPFYLVLPVFMGQWSVRGTHRWIDVAK